MIDIESPLKDAAKVWIDEEARGLSAHPDAETWERYGAGALPAEETEALRDHLVVCRECRRRVLESPRAGTAVVAEPEAGISSADAEERRAWHGLKQRLAEVTPPEPAVLPRAAPAGGRGWGSRVSPWIAVVSLSFAGWLWHQANQPRLGVVIAEAVPAGSSRGAGDATGARGEGRPIALLVPLPVEVEVGTPVRVEILDGAGAVRWRGETRVIAEGEIGLEIPARYRRGGIQVRLSAPAGDGETGGEWKALGTFGVATPTGGGGEAATP